MKLISKKWLAIGLVVCMTILAGCQAVAGVDLAKVFKQMNQVKSAEGKQTVEFKLKINEEQFNEYIMNEVDDEEEAVIIQSIVKQISHIKFEIDHYKVEDQLNSSISGALVLGDNSKIDFDLKQSDTLAVIKLGGAKKPISIDLTGEREKQLRNEFYLTEYGISYDELYGENVEIAIDDEALLESINQVSGFVTDYLSVRIPNVDSLKVEPVNETINGTPTSLLAVQGELKGMELWDWAKKLLAAIVADKEGLSELVTQIFVLMKEQNSAIFDSFNMIGMGDVYSSDEDIIEDYISDDYESKYGDIDFEDMEYEEIDFDEVLEEADPKTEEELLAESVDEVIKALQELQESMKEIEETEAETLKQVLNDSLQIKFKYGVDSSLNVRTQEFSIDYTLDPAFQEEIGLAGLEGFSLSTSTQLWNVNGEVKADEPVITKHTVGFEEFSYMQGYEIVNLFEDQSFIYDVLRNQFEISKQTYYNVLDRDYYGYGMYLNQQKQAMISARDIIEQFGGSISWDKATGSSLLIDDATYTKIEITPGSKQVKVNGEVVEWPAAVEVKDGVTYIPARGIANTLNADITWYAGGELEITRIP